MRPNQKFKHLLRNANFSLALEQDAKIWYKADGGVWETDFATGYIQTIYNPYGTISYSSTQNGKSYLTATTPATPANNLQYAYTYTGGTVSLAPDGYTVMIVAKVSGAGDYWMHGDFSGVNKFTGFFNYTAQRMAYQFNNNASFPGVTTGGGTAICINEFGGEYSPGSFFISVFSISFSDSGNPYMTCNGRGSSGGQYHIPASGLNISGSYGSSFANQVQTVGLSANETAYRCETIMWNKKLTQYQIDYYESILKTKWGITY